LKPSDENYEFYKLYEVEWIITYKNKL
jgi:hypothetical protein